MQLQQDGGTGNEENQNNLKEICRGKNTRFTTDVECLPSVLTGRRVRGGDCGRGLHSPTCEIPESVGGGRQTGDFEVAGGLRLWRPPYPNGLLIA